MCIPSSSRDQKNTSSSIVSATDVIEVDINNKQLFYVPTKQTMSVIDADLMSCPSTCCSTDVSSLDDFSAEHSKSSLRRVTFDVDGNDALVEYHYVYPKNESFDSYTTGSQQAENSKEVIRTCRFMKTRNNKLIRRMNNIYENEEYEKHDNIFNEWAASDLRGFESTFISESAYRIQAYVELTILYYHRLQNIFSKASCDKLKQYDIDELLSRRMRKESERSLQVAIRLATADEIEAGMQSNVKNNTADEIEAWI